ncbi:heat-like repeat-containing protein [Candidatus Vecturithrix granuli]|uniref:Heat-like repeat-containing protein n=1 Tax=Vecturithrix granuli TaxID=1499967 RepID=A0A081BZW1_VECG1|nr:heat-like repeat-containing protein [Candidatus Vecturithrix granuli]
MTEEIYHALQSTDEDTRLRAIVDLETPSTSEEIATLVNMLSDKSWRVRKAVVRILAQTNVNIVVPLLIRALSVGNPGIQNVRFHNSAIECLTMIGTPAIPDLTLALNDEEKNVRIAAANVLGAIRHHDACDALIETLHDSNVNVRYAVVEALAKIPSQKSVIPLTNILEQDDEWLKLPTISALGHIGDYRATPHLMQIAEQPLYLQTVVEALGNIGDERGIPCIIRALSSSDREIRKSAVLSLKTMARKLDKLHEIVQRPPTYKALFRSACTDPMLQYLIEFLEEKDVNLILAAIELLGWSGCQEAAYSLLEKLGDEQVSEAVISALIEIGENAIAPLADAYEQTYNIEKKLLLIDCLRELDGIQALQLLLRYLQETDEELLIYGILQALTHETFITLFQEDRKTPPSPYFTIVQNIYAQYLESSHPLIRAEAISFWGHLFGAEALDMLLNATKDIDPAVRVKAIKLMEQFFASHSELTHQLIVLLSDDHPSIRKQAACTLGNTTDPDAFPALLLILDDSNPTVRRAAVLGIGTFLSHNPQEPYCTEALQRLTDVLEYRCRRYEDGLLKIETCNTLQYIRSEKSKELLVQLAHDVDFDVRKSAIFALGSFREYAASLIGVLHPFLRDAHWSVREATVTTLGLLYAQEMEQDILKMLEDPDITVQKAVLVTLGRIRAVHAIPILIEYLAHDTLDYAAYQGLKQLAAYHPDEVTAYSSHENPKVYLLLNHLLGKD